MKMEAAGMWVFKLVFLVFDMKDYFLTTSGTLFTQPQRPIGIAQSKADMLDPNFNLNINSKAKAIILGESMTEVLMS